MCGRYASFREAQDLADHFAVSAAGIAEDARLLPPSWNVAPTDPVRVVVERETEVDPDAPDRVLRSLRLARWGLVPGWAKDPSIGSRLINARMETVGEKPAFKRAFATRRALLPADGYYEWYTLPSEGGKPLKQPYFIRPADGSVFAMAGLYEFWKAPDGSWLTTATVITTSRCACAASPSVTYDQHSTGPDRARMECRNTRQVTPFVTSTVIGNASGGTLTSGVYRADSGSERGMFRVRT